MVNVDENTEMLIEVFAVIRRLEVLPLPLGFGFLQRSIESIWWGRRALCIVSVVFWWLLVGLQGLGSKIDVVQVPRKHPGIFVLEVDGLLIFTPLALASCSEEVGMRRQHIRVYGEAPRWRFADNDVECAGEVVSNKVSFWNI